MLSKPYLGFRDVFSKESFDELPEWKQWDHTIDLKPESQPFSTKVYPMWRALLDLKPSPAGIFPCPSTGLSTSWEALLDLLLLFSVYVTLSYNPSTHLTLFLQFLLLYFPNTTQNATTGLHSHCYCPARGTQGPSHRR